MPVATSMRSSFEYLPKSTTASNLRMNALSNFENRLVVANKIICSESSSIWLSKVDVARPISRMSCESIRSRASASISSKSTIVWSGRVKLLISANSLVMFFAVWPRRLSMTELKLTTYNSRCMIEEICFTDSVFPVPAGPWKRNLWIPIFRPMALSTPWMSSAMTSGSGREVLTTIFFSRNSDLMSELDDCGTRVFASDSKAMMYAASCESPAWSNSLAILYASLRKAASLCSVWYRIRFSTFFFFMFLSL